MRQIVDRGYNVAEVSERLGASVHSLRKWAKSITPDKSGQQATELVEAKKETLKHRSQLHRKKGSVTY